MDEKNKFELVEDDLFLPGSRIKIEHTLLLDELDISDLLQKTPEEVRDLYHQSVRKEENMYEVLQAGMRAWEHDARNTRRLESALNFLEIAPVEHTGNQWIEDKNGTRMISNTVYKMTCHLSENTKWNLWSAKALNDRWRVEWSVSLNTPLPHHSCVIARKDRKFADRESAENYLNGRISAYSKLFSELSPPVPYERRQFFMESGLVLPGYRIESGERSQEKDPVLEKLSKSKSQKEAAPAAPCKKKNEPAL